MVTIKNRDILNAVENIICHQVNEKENLLYDMDDGIIKELPATGLRLPKGISPFNDNNLTQSNENVKLPSTKYYMQENTNDVQEPILPKPID